MAPVQISDLPVELLIKIFEHLEKPEIYTVAEVCQHWFEITQNQAIINKSIVKVTESKSIDFFYYEKTRKFKFCLRFTLNLPDNFYQFSTKFSENILEVNIVKIKLLNLYDFLTNLTNLKNLKTLKIINCSFSGEGCLPENLCLNLTTLLLTITSNGQMKENQVRQLLSIIPNLKSFTCNLSEDHSLEMAVVDYIKNEKLTKSLKEISFISFKSTALCEIFKTKHLNLNKFFWKTFNNFQINCVADLEKFLINQKELKVLDLYLVQDFLRSIIKICSKTNLDHLSFNLNGERIEDNEILQFLWNIKYLKIYNCNSDIFKSLTKKSEMEKLILIGYKDDLSKNNDKFEFLTNLKYLRVEESYINDDLLQAIIKNLSNLRELYLLDHQLESEITDFGICGTPNGHSMSSLEYLEFVDLFAKSDKITEKSIQHISSLKNIIKANIPRSITMSQENSFNFNSTIYLHRNNNYLKFASSLTTLFELFN